MNRLRLAMGKSVASPLDDWIGGLPLARHAREYTFSEARELIERSGLTVELMTSRHFQISTGVTSRGAQIAKKAIDRLATRYPTLGPEIIIIARRS